MVLAVLLCKQLVKGSELQISCFLSKFKQAQRQDSVTGGAEIKFGGAQEVYLCEFERGTVAREIYPSLDQTNKVKTKNSEGFSG